MLLDKPTPKRWKQNYQTIEGIKRHPRFDLLTPKQQTFLLRYLETGDKTAAASAAYNAKNPDGVAMRELRKANMRALVSIFHGYTNDLAPMTKTELVSLIAARLRRTETSDTAFINLVDTYSELVLGKKPGRPNREEQEKLTEQGVQNIDELVKQIESEKKKNE
jgi:hypothetical protein